ncbi:hypothetical protein DXG03_000397 [Asterophora parasitica]|uniref:Steroid 5-alpha reductase C-terminal domain-containing protein n=1 Tax=Asterophora parasitica TaxID=117018 RepID=A0A9P7GCZ3_9AGAR|nr:hypothetical protein DXG03_000397 [Asterophora parasitica]
MASPASKLHDHVSRIKRPSPLGSTIFVGLRLVEPFLQYAILGQNLGSALITRFGGHVVPLGTPIDNVIGLSPYRLLLLLMSVSCSLKQVFWLLVIGEQEMPLTKAFPILIGNAVINSVNSFLFIWSFTSAASGGAQSFSEDGFPPTPLVVGTVVYVLGTVIEVLSEVQRKRFKDDPRNKGKNYAGGLFSLARHINYTGHLLMRAGWALASSGWIWSGIIALSTFRDFALRGIPVLDHYCQSRVRSTHCIMSAKELLIYTIKPVRGVMDSLQEGRTDPDVPGLILMKK